MLVSLSRLVIAALILLTASFLTLFPAPVQAQIGLQENSSLVQNAQRTEKLQLPVGKAVVIVLPDGENVRDILVSDPNIVDAVVRTAQHVQLLPQQIGKTNILFFNDIQEQILNLQVDVFQNIDNMRDLLSRDFPNTNVEISMVDANLILSGTVRNAAVLRKILDIAESVVGDGGNIINTISITGQEQVLLKVKIAEVNRTIIKQLGLNFRFVSTIGNGFGVGLGTANSFAVNSGPTLGGFSAGPNGGLVALSPSQAVAGASATLTGGGFVGGGRTSSFLGGDAILQALERHALIRTLAEPNLISISGEQASFLVGGEFPIPTASSDSGVTITFQEFGVALSFTPIVLTEGRISLTIEAESSSLDNTTSVTTGGVSVPGLSIRRVQTTVELPSGGSLAIAGLLSQETLSAVQSLPGVKDTPILGALLRSTDFLDNQSELVISVTPYFVNPVNEYDISYPSDGFSPASDYDQYILGRLHAVYGADGVEAPKSGIRGPFGQILE